MGKILVRKNASKCLDFFSSLFFMHTNFNGIVLEQLNGALGKF